MRCWQSGEMSKDVLIFGPETVQEILVNATRALGQTMEYREARLQAELLLSHTLGVSRAMVLARLNEQIDPLTAARYAANVARRAKREPLAYILGHQEFYGLDFWVDRRVLIPRHETELLVLLALQRMQRVPHEAPVVVDVGTGSGALALALAHHVSSSHVIATDLSPDALAVAEMNGRRLNLAERVQWAQGDLLEPMSARFDILVANLPYIPSTRYSDLPDEVRRFEPRMALDGGPDGLDVIRKLMPMLESHAANGGTAFLEISEEQGEAAVELARRHFPLADVVLHRDLEGLARVVEIRMRNQARLVTVHGSRAEAAFGLVEDGQVPPDCC